MPNTSRKLKMEDNISVVSLYLMPRLSSLNPILLLAIGVNTNPQNGLTGGINLKGPGPRLTKCFNTIRAVRFLNQRGL